MRLSDLDTVEDVLAEDLRDPAFRAERDRMAFAREVVKAADRGGSWTRNTLLPTCTVRAGHFSI